MNVDKSIRQLHERLDASHASFQECFGHLSELELLMKPNPCSWSIGQNVEHLIAINESYYPTLQALHQGSYDVPFHGKIGFVVRFMGREILKSVQATHTRRYKTFPIWEPRNESLGADLLERFADHHDVLKANILGAKVFLEQDVVIASPGSRKVVYTLRTAFDIVVAHEFRHLEQAKRVMAYLGLSRS
ncbi:MAG: DinB family protein [Bacteroidetes bacterium]|jgi:hypothetical protein|nr:DinB family protein [Bacteroidota bacterium]